MKKPVSARRLKKLNQKQAESPKSVTTISENNIAKVEVHQNVEDFSVELSASLYQRLDEIKLNQLKLQQQVDKIEFSIDKQSLNFKELSTELTKSIKDHFEKDKVVILDKIEKIVSILGDKITNATKHEISTINGLLRAKKEDIEVERTISYQLGKELIESSKSLKQMIYLPKKILAIRNENLKRKQNKQLKTVRVSPAKELNVIKQNVLTLKELLDKSNSDSNRHFDGNLSKFIGLKNHPEIKVSSAKNVSIQVSSILQKSRYFNSENLFDVEDLQDFINKNGEIVFTSDVISEGLVVDFIISFYNKDRKKITRKVFKPSKKLNILLEIETKYVGFGVKVSNQGSAIINHVALLEIGRKFNPKSVQQTVDSINGSQLDDGVTIIMPSYKGEQTICDALMSVVNQKKIDLNKLEIIVVLNGELDNTPKLVEEFVKNNGYFSVKLLYSAKKGASAARNLGIENATKQYTIFLDDDDMLSEEYISSMYDIMTKESIAVAYIHDLTENGVIIEDNALNIQIRNAKKNPSLETCSSAITLIACKMLPTNNLKKIRFDENLRSGEDVAYFTQYVDIYQPKVLLTQNEQAYYIRRLRDISVSRQPMSFDFNVIQRLDVISTILKNSKVLTPFSLSKVKAQINFIVSYLKEYPVDLEKVLEEIIIRKMNDFPFEYFWSKLGRVQAEQLVFSYCHAPFVDTSGTIVAKRINQFGLLSDVVANDMSTHRELDISLLQINKHYLKDVYFTTTTTSFGGWDAIKAYTELANELVRNKEYKQIYSRVLWPASNFAAALYKINHPHVKWIAEFSDPVVLDIEGKDRQSILEDQQFIAKVLGTKRKELGYLHEEKNLYVWCELLAYLLADEIIFTCDNQRKLMLDKFKYPEISLAAYAKSVIMPHPVLPKCFYSLSDIHLGLDSATYNIAYFGVFYKNRNLDDLVKVIKRIKENTSKKIKLYVYTNQSEQLKAYVTQLGCNDYIDVFNYISYFDFLKVSTLFDGLIVNDTKASGLFGFNPYLPSKISDYLGSGRPIIALKDGESTLDKVHGIQYKADLDDPEDMYNVIIQAMDAVSI